MVIGLITWPHNFDQICLDADEAGGYLCLRVSVRDLLLETAVAQ
jgi:hypothetical protein